MQAQDKKGFSLQEIHNLLRNSGGRLTPQREYILDVFFKAEPGFHLNAEDIHKVLVKKHKANISLATVYRTVKTLSSMGVLREVDLAEGHKHYELASGRQDPHHHIICLNCNKTIEFFNNEINQLAQNIAEKYNVEILDIELKIYANCQHNLQAETNLPQYYTGLSEHRR